MRYTVLDSWRGLAALIVALFHLPVAGHLFHTPIVRHGFLFVDFFFVLSGFVISHAYLGRLGNAYQLAGFLVRRLGRLWPLHAAVLAAWLSLEAVKLMATGSGFERGGPTDLGALPSHLTLTHAFGMFDRLTWNGQSWSIGAEFWMYVVFGLVCFWCTRKWRTPILLMLGVTAASVIAATSDSGIEVTYDQGFLRCVYGFVTGYVVYLAHASRTALSDGPSRHDQTWAWAWEALSVALVAVFVAVAGNGPLSVAAPIVFALPVLVFAREAGPVSRLLNWAPLQTLGRWSYTVYMVHGLIVYVLALAAYQLQRSTGTTLWQGIVTDEGPLKAIVANPWALDLVWLFYAALVIGIGAVCHRLIEQPGRAWFGRLADGLERSKDQSALSASR